jgi:hypothetical protein
MSIITAWIDETDQIHGWTTGTNIVTCPLGIEEHLEKHKIPEGAYLVGDYGNRTCDVVVSVYVKRGTSPSMSTDFPDELQHTHGSEYYVKWKGEIINDVYRMIPLIDDSTLCMPPPPKSFFSSWWNPKSEPSAPPPTLRKSSANHKDTLDMLNVGDTIGWTFTNSTTVWKPTMFVQTIVRHPHKVIVTNEKGQSFEFPYPNTSHECKEVHIIMF